MYFWNHFRVPACKHTPSIQTANEQTYPIGHDTAFAHGNPPESTNSQCNWCNNYTAPLKRDALNHVPLCLHAASPKKGKLLGGVLLKMAISSRSGRERSCNSARRVCCHLVPIHLQDPIHVLAVLKGTRLPSWLLRLHAHSASVAERQYSTESFTRVLRTQCYHVFRSGDIPKSVTAEMRNVLLDWLVQVHEYLALEEETLYLAVYLMNSYIRSHKIHTSMLQLLASTCLFIACKVEESLIPEPAELCFMMEDAFSKKDLMRMERKVLNRLKFDLRYTQPLYFLHLLSITGKCPEKTHYLAMYFMELTLREADALTIEPALLACAALRLAHMVLALESRSLNSDLKWPGVLHLYSYRDAELISSQQLMAQFALRGEAKSTWQKYSRPQKHEVSTEPALNAKNLIRCISSLSVIPV
ncbi:cyclin N-terminal domain-containing 2 [Pelobates cultripes]|uniref:Cyclin N-terminal domain-containing 2 n=1 Tax=Pelobates cultripes TaxID=61616 RepID=A0AAD1WMA1_PELCU|nr:cyclin N-terminal domain-containing 2 [Pelobates cultripes]